MRINRALTPTPEEVLPGGFMVGSPEYFAAQKERRARLEGRATTPVVCVRRMPAQMDVAPPEDSPKAAPVKPQRIRPLIAFKPARPVSVADVQPPPRGPAGDVERYRRALEKEWRGKVEKLEGQLEAQRAHYESRISVLQKQIDALCGSVGESYRDAVRRIMRVACHRHGVLEGDLTSQQRKNLFMFPRFEVIWRLRRETAASLPQIGKSLGGRDHTTILHSIMRFEQCLAAGDAWARAASDESNAWLARAEAARAAVL